MNPSITELAGGPDAFVRLVDAFYDRVEQDTTLRPMYPEDLEPGEVLIAPQTDPSWVPLFVPAAAVVVNVGAINTGTASCSVWNCCHRSLIVSLIVSG